MNNIFIITFDGKYSKCHMTRTDENNAIQAYVDLRANSLNPNMCRVNLDTFTLTKLRVVVINEVNTLVGVL